MATGLQERGDSVCAQTFPTLGKQEASFMSRLWAARRECPHLSIPYATSVSKEGGKSYFPAKERAELPFGREIMTSSGHPCHPPMQAMASPARRPSGDRRGSEWSTAKLNSTPDSASQPCDSGRVASPPRTSAPPWKQRDPTSTVCEPFSGRVFSYYRNLGFSLTAGSRQSHEPKGQVFDSDSSRFKRRTGDRMKVRNHLP